MSAVQFELSFRSAWFQPVPGEEAATNSGPFGKALAIWLADRLRARGVAPAGQIDELVTHPVQIAHELPQASEIVCEHRPA